MLEQRMQPVKLVLRFTKTNRLQLPNLSPSEFHTCQKLSPKLPKGFTFTAFEQMEKTSLHFSRPEDNTNKSDESCLTSFAQNTFENNPNCNFLLNQNEYSQILLDPTLSFINQILLEEEDSNINGSQEEVALQNMEKLFYETIGQIYPSSPNNMPVENPNLQLQDNFSSISKNYIQEFAIENSLESEFQKGVEEGKKFLPSVNKLAIDSSASTPFVHKTHKKHGILDEFKLEEGNGSTGQKNPSDRGLDVLEGPNRKLSVVYCDEPIRDERFDKVLLNHEINHIKDEITSLREIKWSETSLIAKNETQEELLDLRDLLIRCSQAVAINDYLIAGPLIKKIRKHSSSVGDGMKRLAFILADGLEARLAGTGSDIYRRLLARKITASEILKVHHLMNMATPFFKVSYKFAKCTILDVAKNASKLHIIDFGIDFGFQWPSLIQHLSIMKDKIPKLRISGVIIPQPGFRPAQRVDETGRRLADYAKSFNVPFEYHGITSQNWETLTVEDFHFEKDEVLVVYSMYRFRLLGDETIAMNSARTRVLNLIREINPKIFILGIINASSSPVFVRRFQHTLHFWSSFFDMLDSTVPWDNNERQLIERVIARQSAISSIACEGSEVMEKSETYKQWGMRNLRAGFRQLPLDMEFVKSTKDNVGQVYDQRFFVDGDQEWLLQGWKGRVFYAISTWKPKET